MICEQLEVLPRSRKVVSLIEIWTDEYFKFSHEMYTFAVKCLLQNFCNFCL